MQKERLPLILQYFLRPFLAIVFLCVATGCRHFGSGEVSAVSASYRFDPKVIEKLPVYDSLASAILEKFSFFRQHINEKESYRSYKYMPFSNQTDVFRKLPPEVAPKIDKYFNQLGKGFIYGFDVFRDSTIKVYIRSTSSDIAQVDIDENLSYYPAGNIFRRELPVRDTMLNEHWQYWSRFERVLF